MSNNMFACIAGAAVIGVGTLASTAVEAKNMTLRFGQWIPVKHFSQGQGLHKYFAAIAKVTNGRVKIIPSAKSLGPPPRQLQLAIDGVADMAWGVHGYQPGVYPLAEMAALPFVSTTTTGNSVAYWRVYKKHFEKAGMHPKGIHLLGLHVHPPGHIYNNVRSIERVSDLKGLKLRATNAVVSQAFATFGAVPISPAGGVTALHQGLSKGVMDGTSFTDEAIFNFRVTKFIKYATHVHGGLYNTSFYIVMNQGKWNKVSNRDQAAIMKVSGEAFTRRIGVLWDAQETAATPKLKAKGIKIVEADAPMMGAFKKAMVKVKAAWLAKAKKAGVDGEAALKMYLDESAK